MNPTPTARYYGDPAKPGYPSPAAIAEMDRVADCADLGHPRFTAADTNPRRPLDQCPGCGSFLRTINTEGDRPAEDFGDEEHAIRTAEDAYERHLGL